VIHPALVNLSKNNQLDWNTMNGAETCLKKELEKIHAKMTM